MDISKYYNKNNCHFYYEKSVKKCKEFKVHSDGCYPECLIEDRRPNEPLEVLEYRKKIWVPKTKPTFTRIISSLSKIRRSADWSVKYEELDKFTKIAEGENLDDYCETDFPYFGSVTNWVFSVLLKKYLTDPNGCVLIMPLNKDAAENVYLRPYPYIFDCSDVIEFISDEYAVLNDPEGCVYMVKNKAKKGLSYFIVDTVSIKKFDQVDDKGTMQEVESYDHGIGILPVFKLGGIICESEGIDFLYESRIQGIIPELDEAVREYSDLQAAKVLHIYPERWEFTQSECATCKGTGRRNNPAYHDGCDQGIPAQITCDNRDCNNGYVASGPYSKLLVRAISAMEGGGQVPIPPAGYVEKDVEIVKVMEESIARHIYNALAAINFQFLDQSPLNQSGVAKEVDKDELNNTVHAIAEDIIRIMDLVYKLVAYYRYKISYSFPEIEEMLPKIPVPERFDILSSKHFEDSLVNAKKGGLNPVLVNAQEIEYANKKFNNDPEVRERLELILQLDPLPNISEDDKMSRLSNKGITQQSYVISSNIQEFVQRAIDEDEDFADKKLEDQKKIMVKYAQEIIDALDNAKKIIEDVLPPAPTNADPNNPEPPNPVQSLTDPIIPEPLENGV